MRPIREAARAVLARALRAELRAVRAQLKAGARERALEQVLVQAKVARLEERERTAKERLARLQASSTRPARKSAASSRP